MPRAPQGWAMAGNPQLQTGSPRSAHPHSLPTRGFFLNWCSDKITWPAAIRNAANIQKLRVYSLQDVKRSLVQWGTGLFISFLVEPPFHMRCRIMESFRPPGLKCTGNFFSKKIKTRNSTNFKYLSAFIPWTNPSWVWHKWVGTLFCAHNDPQRRHSNQHKANYIRGLLKTFSFLQWHLVNKTTTERSEKTSRLKNAVPLQHVSKSVFLAEVFSSTQVVVVFIERHLRLWTLYDF